MSNILVTAAHVVPRFYIPTDVMVKLAGDLNHINDSIFVIATKLREAGPEVPPVLFHALVLLSVHVNAIEDTLKVVIEENAPQGAKNG